MHVLGGTYRPERQVADRLFDQPSGHLTERYIEQLNKNVDYQSLMLTLVWIEHTTERTGRGALHSLALPLS